MTSSLPVRKPGRILDNAPCALIQGTLSQSSTLYIYLWTLCMFRYGERNNLSFALPADTVIGHEFLGVQVFRFDLR